MNCLKTMIWMAAMLMCGSHALAQDDPTLMTVNGKPVTRSEFEYSYNKNNTESVIDRKTVEEYMELFVNYKLKVEAALAARLDTLSSFQKEFAGYRDQQVRPSVVSDADMEQEARKIYNDYKTRVDGSGGLVKPAHILVMMRQKASADDQQRAKQRIDSIYQALQAGADFAEMARHCSDDKGSAVRGGELSWIEHGQTLQEFEDRAFALKVGEMSSPFVSPAGWHIVLLRDKSNCFPYDSLRTDIMRFIDQRGLRDQIAAQRIDSMAKAASPQLTSAELLTRMCDEMTATDKDLKYLIQEYHDGLLLYEISNREVWEKAQKDEAGLRDYFAKHRNKYRWEAPRYKGIAYHVKVKDDVKAVKKVLKKLPFNEWADKLRSTFNADSVLRIRVEKGIFKKGDNATVDRMVFKEGGEAGTVKDFPIDAVYGKKLTTPQELDDVRNLVLADYQEQLEKDWVARLRNRYPVTIDERVLKTVNKH